MKKQVLLVCLCLVILFSACGSKEKPTIYAEKCPICKGKGFRWPNRIYYLIWFIPSPCDRCGGDGWVNDSKYVNIKSIKVLNTNQPISTSGPKSSNSESSQNTVNHGTTNNYGNASSQGWNSSYEQSQTSSYEEESNRREKESQYKRWYQMYENRVNENISSLQLLEQVDANYSAISGMRMNIRSAQNELIRTRQEAAREGIYLEQSPMEYASY